MKVNRVWSRSVHDSKTWVPFTMKMVPSASEYLFREGMQLLPVPFAELWQKFYREFIEPIRKCYRHYETIRCSWHILLSSRGRRRGYWSCLMTSESLDALNSYQIYHFTTLPRSAESPLVGSTTCRKSKRHTYISGVLLWVLQRGYILWYLGRRQFRTIDKQSIHRRLCVSVSRYILSFFRNRSHICDLFGREFDV